MNKIFAITLLYVSICLSVSAQRPADTAQLAFVKNNISNIPNAVQARDALIKNADKELKKEIIPVAVKTIVAGSGDKHDYVSMGPYWWADTSKPDGLPYIRKDGQRNPEIQKLDRTKVDRLMKSVMALSYAYYFTHEERYAAKATDNLKIWFLNEDTRMNPNLNYAQIIPGRNNDKGRAEGIIDVYSFIYLVDCIRMLETSDAMDCETYTGLKKWFSDFTDWLLTSDIGKDEHSAKNNHGLAYDIQVTAYALFTGRNDIADKFIADFPEKRLFAQIEPDGSQPLELERTIALHYSIFNINHAMDMCDLAKSRGVELFHATSPDGRSISKAIDFIRIYLGKAQNEFPYKQIKEWDENQYKLCWMLRRSTLFQPNAEFDKLFDTHCKTVPHDMKWIYFGK